MQVIAIILVALLAGLAAGCSNTAPEPATAPVSPSPSAIPRGETPPSEPARSTPPAVLPASAATAVVPTSALQFATPNPEAARTARPVQLPTETALPAPPPPAPQLENLRLEPVLTTRSFRDPTNLIQLKDGRVLVAEQAGRVWSLDGLRGEGVAATEALDITDRVSSRRSEEGLLGLAADPNADRHLYLYYSAGGPRRSVVSRFTLSPDGASIDPGSELVILAVAQPYANHNGGQLAFGPDGHLYIGLGDGGSAGDPEGNGQNTATLLGSILRIDVSQTSPERLYAIPSDNPLAGGNGRGEIWAYGLRNPWRFSFDRSTGDLWAGDVGQNRWEEIDIIQRGGNHGWNVLEGNHCYGTRGECLREGMTPPVWEYSLDGEPCSVIGGYVYRGSAIPWLVGAYVYGDYCSGEVFGLRYVDGEVVEHRELADTDFRIMSFAQDNDGELYLLSQESGVHRLVSE